MKILQISHRIPFPLNEGGTIGIYNYTRGFSEAGHEVTLFALAPKKHHLPESEIREALEPYCKLEIHPIDTDIKPLDAFLNLFGTSSYNVNRFYDKAFELRLQKHLESEQYDIIQIEGTYASPYSQTALDYANCPVVLRQHNVEYQIWERRASTSSNPFKKWYLSLLSKRLKKHESKHLNQYSAIVPVTEDDANLFKALGCNVPIYASPAGIDIHLWKPSNTSIIPHSYYHIGSLEWAPNLDAVTWFLEEVWPLLLEKTPEAQFYIAGKGMPDSLKDRSISNVHMVGEVRDAVEFSRDKLCCVVPLRSGSGIRLKILEAMSAGKVVISSTIGAQGIAYTNNQNILIADKPLEYVEEIEKITNSPEFAERLGKNARQLIVDHYSNQSVVQKLLLFYRELKNKNELLDKLVSNN